MNERNTEQGWRPIAEAPKDGTVIRARYSWEEGSEFLTTWSEHRVCMLGPRAGECGAGWATVAPETDGNLPIDEPDEWTFHERPQVTP